MGPETNQEDIEEVQIENDVELVGENLIPPRPTLSKVNSQNFKIPKIELEKMVPYS